MNNLGACRRRRRAAALVELAIALPVLCYLSVGVAEVGFIVRDYMVCQSAAYRGARSASLAESVEMIIERAKSGMPASMADAATVTAQARWFWAEGVSTPWQPLTDVDDGVRVTNSAQPGQHVRVVVTYRHRLLTRLLTFLDPDGDGVLAITAAAIAEREDI